jgi:hypothetical protein
VLQFSSQATAVPASGARDLLLLFKIQFNAPTSIDIAGIAPYATYHLATLKERTTPPQTSGMSKVLRGANQRWRFCAPANSGRVGS